MSDIKVSVIVPCYNVEKLLPKCLDSLVNQTLTDIEIICVNDASPDNGIAILRDYEARYPNIRVIDLKKNVCLGGARNRGMEIARGEYIAFVDSDDYVEPDMYEKLYARAQATGADVVACDYDLVDNNYQLIGKRVVDRTHLCGPVDEETRKALYLHMGTAWGRIHRREFLVAHEIKFPEHIFFEDLYFNLVESLYVRHFEYVPQCYYKYYYNPQSIVRSNASLRKTSDRIRSLDLALDYFRDKGVASHYAALLNYVVARATLENLTTYCDLDLPFLREARFILKTRSLSPQGKNPIFRSMLTRKERLHIALLRFSSRLYWLLVNARKMIRHLR